MTVWWCRGCGMEDTRAHDACPSCGSALQTADIEWLKEGTERNETVFELEMLPHERAAIVDALMANNIRHRWEGPNDLVVADASGDEVDGILDEVLGEDEDDGDDEGGDQMSSDDFELSPSDQDIFLDADPYGTASDNGYEVLSRLFLATGKVLRSRDDSDDVEDFADAAAQVVSTGTPFGIDEETWADIQSAARNISKMLADDPKAQADGDLKGLHNQLQQLV